VDFEFSAEQEALRDTVRRFLADRAPLSWVRDRWGDNRGTTAEVWEGLAALGLTGLLVAEQWGGTGAGMVDMGVVLEEMGRMVHPGPFLSSAVGAVSLVAGVGTEADQADLLPGLASGERTGALAVLEPGRRGDCRQPRASSLPGAGGTWSLTGTKEPVFDAMAAGVLLVTAAVPEGGSGVFVVDPASSGVTLDVLMRMDGSRPAARVVLDEAPARRLGQGEDATEAVATAVDRLVVGLVVDGVGAAAAALDLAVAYARERVQFGRPIGSFQAVQHLCADMLQVVELARAGAYYGLWAADAAPGAERRRAATMAKAYASAVLPRVGATAIQVLGGVGFTWEHDAHLYYKRLLTLQEAWGGEAEHLEALAAQVV
jgi:alkylation response protein AidB-like acyl-CoA dehydrogenase